MHKDQSNSGINIGIASFSEQSADESLSNLNPKVHFVDKPPKLDLAARMGVIKPATAQSSARRNLIAKNAQNAQKYKKIIENYKNIIKDLRKSFLEIFGW